MRFMLTLILAGLVSSTTSGVAEFYPRFRTKPFQMVAKDQAYFQTLFDHTGKMVAEGAGSNAIFVAAIYVLKNNDNAEYTVCGSGVTESDQKKIVFVVSHGHTYLSPTDEGWASLGCTTEGGTMLKWMPKDGGGGGQEIRIVPVQNSPSRDAAPPSSPFIPPAARLKMAFEFESNLSQALGTRVRVTSLKAYTERDGTTTFCTVATSGSSKIRIVKGAGEPTMQPTEAQWVARGCTRPNFLLIR